MVAVKIIAEKKGKEDWLSRLTKYLTVSLALLTGVIVLLVHDNPSITGYSVFSGVYGTFSPFIIVLLLVIVIFVYLKVR